jgi:hypothetical protein
MFKNSGNPKVKELTKSIRERSYNLSSLKPIKSEELNEKGKPKRFCAWCAIEEVFHFNRKYCSSSCSTSAMAWAYPQKEDALRFLLVRQDWKCAHCSYDYSIIMDELIKKERTRRPYVVENKAPIEELPWYYFKRLKRATPKNHKPEVDHIVPIYKGGESLGLDNHNILCYTCHKNKTKIDLSGKRIKLDDDRSS